MINPLFILHFFYKYSRGSGGSRPQFPIHWSYTHHSSFGALAQLGERLICIQEVRSSILLGSTKGGSTKPFVAHEYDNETHPKGSVAQVVRAHA